VFGFQHKRGQFRQIRAVHSLRLAELADVVDDHQEHKQVLNRPQELAVLANFVKLPKQRAPGSQDVAQRGVDAGRSRLVAVDSGAKRVEVGGGLEGHSSHFP